MIYNKKQVDDAKKEFSKNEYWKEYYEKAPSMECKEYIELQFCYSLYGADDKKKYRQKKEELEKELGYSDAEWLYKYCGNNPARSKFRRMMEEKK